MTHRFGAVVLAAGGASRFGATKQLAELDGRPLVRHAVDAARAAGADPVVVVVGHDAERVAAAADTGERPPDGRGTWAVHNAAWAEGQASSVVAGMRALAGDDGVDVAVVLLADVPGVAPAAVRAVVEAARTSGTGARAVHDDGPSHPVAFARPAWTALGDLRGDRGARQLRDLELLDVVVPGPRPRDVDHPDDLDRA